VSQPGRLITLEGGEGSGKTTQINGLREFLQTLVADVVVTREPGGSDGAEQIRRLLVNGETSRWTPLSEALLHYAARQDHLDKTVLPALSRGAWVVCDRFADSTTAYQGYGQGLGPELIAKLHELTLGSFAPDLTFVLDLPPEIGLERTRRRNGDEDRYERMDLSFHRRLRDGFLAIARSAPRRCVVVDATADAATVQAVLRMTLCQRFGFAP
jgi:dTMP kinase